MKNFINNILTFLKLSNSKKFKKHNVFKSAEFNNSINEKGFVIINILSNNDIELLIEYFNNLNQTHNNLFTTFLSDDYLYKKDIDKKIKEVFNSSFYELFSDYEPLWGNFFPKHSGSPEMPLHADFQYVKEPDEISVNIWCPLVNSNSENGSLGIIPYSHRIVNQIRGTNTYRFYLKNEQYIINNFGIIPSLRPGQAIIYDHRLLHYSPPNISKKNRLAATLICKPKNAQVIHYYSDNEEEKITKYLVKSTNDLLEMKFKVRPNHLTILEDNIHNSKNDFNSDDLKRYRKKIQNLKYLEVI